MRKHYAMSETIKYRLGNQPEEYRLETMYLGWAPKGDPNWENFSRAELLALSSDKPKEVTLLSPDGNNGKKLLFHHALSKDAFPLSLFGEERASNWFRFYKVEDPEVPGIQFVIPLH